ncbi:helix-turn-helix transcriptional regulator [Pontibacter sp. G13]|uniref:AraC family transcriptional regulator n=1 Tax=Pontibacter sp. G13 TaxID=3074898 RepID=UPI00288A38C2|nr:helix-turn-helix transcriptional regulator [Pontibacter sp. G13]WNJ19841.1 helix-turn-helix transcriptional regulator [Pontibacter sp. G13]
MKRLPIRLTHYDVFEPRPEFEMARLEIGGHAFAGFKTYNQGVFMGFRLRQFGFNMVLSGEKTVSDGSTRLQTQSGDVFFAKAGSYLVIQIQENQDYSSISVTLNPELVQRFVMKNPELMQAPEVVSKPSLFLEEDPRIQAYLRSLAEYCKDPRTHKTGLLEVKFEELLHIMLAVDPSGYYARLLRNLGTEHEQSQFRRTMESLITQSVTVSEMAEKAGRSLTDFKREFSRNYGMPPKRWINHQRLKLAHLYLTTTPLNVTEVCYEVGFEHVSHFIRRFKEQYGVTPKELKLQSKGTGVGM